MKKYLYIVSGYIKNNDIDIIPISKGHIGILPVFDNESDANEFSKTIKDSIVVRISYDPTKNDLHII